MDDFTNELTERSAADDRSMVLTLREPVKSAVNGEMVHELHLKEPTVAEWLYASKELGFESEVHLVAVVSKVSPATVKQIGMGDFVRARDFLLGFIRSSPPDGRV